MLYIVLQGGRGRGDAMSDRALLAVVLCGLAVQWLLDEARPRLEQRDDDGGTAFLIAVSFGRLEIMRQENAYLLRHFNSPFYPDRLGTKYRESTQHEMMRFLTGCWRRQGATAML